MVLPSNKMPASDPAEADRKSDSDDDFASTLPNPIANADPDLGAFVKPARGPPGPSPQASQPPPLSAAQRAMNLAAKERLTPPQSPNHEVNYESDELEYAATRIDPNSQQSRDLIAKQQAAFDLVKSNKARLAQEEHDILDDLPDFDRAANGLPESPV